MSLGAIPGTGPATSPMPIIRKSTARTMADLPSDRTLVMGILNINDDSFSDGGKYLLVDDAISHGLAMYYGGADIIDIGGESTRPGAVPVDPAVEQARILPVITALAKAGAIISVDTMHTSTARAALAAGAHIINDVSGLTHEPDMPALMAETGAPYVLMHRRGDAGNMVTEANYTDVVSEVLAELEELRSRFIAAGVKPEALILDPGLGFAKDHEHNWDLLRALDRFTALGHRVLVGTSRKRFLGELLRQDGKPAAPAERDAATAATSALAAANGAWGVRVHDVPSSLAAIKVAGAWMNSRVPAL
ncbi:dihydropteroate synthase [Paeniglutamicibacter terrestris]|jgi:dihydropteroate synthase|uniref:dihydropteroate synthase n=1 Tax=Paeniglutamicibacter terrestris TaxID=2723403 RepID=A0ABX1G9L8_9MICC|nr:dihydropteroate synthase [Paeniglutamicibacter terrestris]NKG22744.1 dihydropteroate synthase [Paeniglutamicibacter terrestris]